MDSTNLTHHFLIAMPGLMDPNFNQAVIYVCFHSEEGALGVIINKPSDVMLGEMLQQMDIPLQEGIVKDIPVYNGGPVQSGQSFILHKNNHHNDALLNINDKINISTSIDILNIAMHSKVPEDIFIALGYASWSSGQLEEEMQCNTWLSSPAALKIIFDTPVNQRWNSAVDLLGVDINQLSYHVGRA